MSTFTDDDNGAGEFGGGTHSSTQWDAGNTWVEQSTNGVSGDFTSRIMDSSANSVWSNFRWVPQRPLQKELPNSGAVESAYTTGNIDMTNSVLLLHMNESSGNAVDSSSTGATCTTSMSAYSATGKLNTAMDFELGSTSNINCGDSTAFSPTDGSGTDTSFSMCVWLNPETVDTNGAMLIAKTTQASSATEWYLNFRGTAPYTGKPSLVLYSGGGTSAWIRGTGSTALTTGTWHHVCATYSGSETNTGIKIYVNGVEDSTTRDSSGTYTGISNTTTALSVGRYLHATPYYYDGLMDEVVIFKGEELTANEVLDIYKRGALRLKMQVRTCDDAACSGESFVGPAGSISAYFEEEDSNTIALPVRSLSSSEAVNNRYFQYKAFLESDSGSYSPELKSVSVDYVTGVVNACVSNATGSWAAAGTWTSCGGTYPGASDTATILNGHTVTTSGTSTITVISLAIQSGGVLNHSDNTTTKSNVIDISAGMVDIQSGGSVNVDYLGYDGGNSVDGSGTGGGDSSASGECGGGGAGHGGTGGNGICAVAAAGIGGVAYGAALAPIDLGSGGGGGNYGTHTQGAGGGAVKFTITGGGTFTMAGTITADGQAGNGSDDGQGGGAGGSVYINFSANGTFTGAGSITADGGAGSTTADDGGGGGGGRIAIIGYSDISGFSGTLQAYGGSGPDTAGSGAAGTIVKDAAGAGDYSGNLIVDNNSTSDASGETDQVDSSLEFATVKVQGTAIYDVPSGKTLILQNSTFTAGASAATFKVSAGTFKTQSAFTIPSSTTFIRSANSTYTDTSDAAITTLTVASGGTLTTAHYTNSTSAWTIGTLSVSGTLNHLAAQTTSLNGNIDSSTTTITVLTTEDFPSAGTIYIESEQMTCTGKTATTFTGCTRGANSTAAATHNSRTAVYAGSLQSKIKISAGTITIGAGGSVNVDNKGYAGGNSVDGYGVSGGDSSASGECGGGGGSHGGVGGNGICAVAAAGIGGTSTYGATLAPVEWGSGGGGGNYGTHTQGAGGGAVEFAVTGGGTFTLTGDITADGQAGDGSDDGQGGGAGGSVYINFTANGTFTGAGTITADGGAGATTADDGGGGGGGRIAIIGYNDISGFSGTHQAFGGTGPDTAGSGASGTIVKDAAGGTDYSGNLIVDNNSISDASGETDQSDSSLEFATVKVQGTAIYDLPSGKTLTLQNSTFTAGTSSGTFKISAGTLKTQSAITIPNNAIVILAGTFTDTSDAALTTLSISSGGTFSLLGFTNSSSAFTVGTLNVSGTLTHEAQQTTSLNGAINNSTTTITVLSTDYFPNSGTIGIEEEKITYTGKTSTTLTGCTRGANSTTAASHATKLTVYPGSLQSKLKMSAGTITVNTGGSVNVANKGYPGGINSVNGYGSGGGDSHTSGECGGGGGGHGGAGGNGQCSVGGQATGGSTYDTASAPVDLGSGGGGGNFGTHSAGYGGGAVELAVTGGGTFTLSGTITAAGQAGTGSADDAQGGGAGGSIYIRFTTGGTFTGTNGTLTVAGGAGGTNNDHGGGGGGGLVSVTGYTTNSASGLTTTTSAGAKGGGTATDGSSGASSFTMGGRRIMLISGVRQDQGALFSIR